MSLSLQRFTNGDTNYVAKHNANAASLEAELASLRSLLGGDIFVSPIGDGRRAAQAIDDIVAGRRIGRRILLRPPAQVTRVLIDLTARAETA